MTRLARAESGVMLACIAAGAMVGFSVLGSAALGSAAGAAVGIAVLAAARRGPAARTH
jgi:hypothetical protein